MDWSPTAVQMLELLELQKDARPEWIEETKRLAPHVATLCSSTVVTFEHVAEAWNFGTGSPQENIIHMRDYGRKWRAYMKDHRQREKTLVRRYLDLLRISRGLNPKNT